MIIGSGGREHAIAWKVHQSPLCDKLFICPGNAGTAQLGTNLPIKVMDFEGLANAAEANAIDFIIVGPDDPLAFGIVDFFAKHKYTKKIPVLGPPAQGAQLEGSKAFAKAFMQRHKIPTASYVTFSIEEEEKAYEYVAKHSLPVVIKADGLAAGKGVAVCTAHEEAKDFLDEIWEAEKFGKAGERIVVEQFLKGIELSMFILTDGKNYILLPEAKDYKRIGEGDTGPNTGGMGAVSPVPFADEAFMKRVKERIIEPTVKGLQKEGIPYRGFIFFGLINVNGDPYVIEYNARMGDPETQVVFPRIKDDILPLLLDAAKGELKENKIAFDKRFATAVIAVSKGYPDTPQTGKLIEGLDKVKKAIVFHAGTRQEGEEIRTSGGRVLAFTVLANTLQEALNASYAELEKVSFEGQYFRKDIGRDLQIQSGKN
jgi:phosphoribosylamine--glycine ligase